MNVGFGAAAVDESARGAWKIDTPSEFAAREPTLPGTVPNPSYLRSQARSPGRSARNCGLLVATLRLDRLRTS